MAKTGSSVAADKSKNDPARSYLEKAMAMCAGRESCRYETGLKLISWGADKELAEKILDRLVKEKFIDELRYAKAFARDKFRQNKWGRIKIGAELSMKRIPGEIIKEATEQIDDELYINTIRSLLIHQKKKVKARNQYELKGKLLRYGLSKGFESHLLYDILNETGDE